jgi:hypothetical protein
MLAPCHIVFDSGFDILQISDTMKRSKRTCVGKTLTDRFRISSAGIDGVSGMDWDEFHTAALVTSEHQQSFCFETKNEFSKSGKPFSYVGKILFLKNESGFDHAAVFLGSPNVNTLEEMYDQGVSVGDLKNKDDSRMQMLLNQASMKHFQESSSEVSNIIFTHS